MTACRTKDCERPARMAIKTTRPTRANLQYTVYSDNRSAAKTAIPYCKECGMETLAQLLEVTVDNDEVMVR